LSFDGNLKLFFVKSRLKERRYTLSASDRSQAKKSAGDPRITEAEFQQIRESLQGLLFGSVAITVQDGVIVQIDRTEKRRLRKGKLNNSEDQTPGGHADRDQALVKGL